MLAQVRRARGLRGEVVAESFGSNPERFQPGLRLFASPAGSSEAARELMVERSWIHGGQLVLQFQGVTSRTEAEQLRGLELRIPLEERPPAPEGEYYLSDLIGCRMETTGGRLIGEVRGYQDYGATPLLEVQHGDRQFLIPFAEAIYREIDLTERRIVVELPEGLEEL